MGELEDMNKHFEIEKAAVFWIGSHFIRLENVRQARRATMEGTKKIDVFSLGV